MPSNQVKHWGKQSLKRTASLMHLLRLSHVSPTRILTYHSVGERDHEMNVSVENFRAQMDWLEEHALVIPLSTSIHTTPGVAITFDDGYRDNLTNAAPILVEHDFPGTVFVVPGKAGGFLAHDEPGDHAQLMDWDEIRALELMGISIGGHTLSHARLSQLSQAEQQEEIQRCATILESELGHPIEFFAYPYGSKLDYTPYSVRCAQEAGYELAVSNRYGPVVSGSSLWELPRIWIDRSDTLETFAQKVKGELDALSWLDSYWGIRARRVANRILGVR